MLVGIVTTSYPRWDGDAAGCFVAGHAAYLRSTGAEVEIIAAGDDAVDAAWDEREQVTRVAARAGLFYAGGAPEAISSGAGLSAIAFAARLATKVVARGQRWDAVAAHWLAPSAMAACAIAGPLLAIAHGGDVHLLASTGLLAGTLRVLESRKARLAFVSEPLRARAIEAHPSAASAIVQPMAIDGVRAARVVEARAARSSAATDDDDAPITLAILARLVPIKSIDTAIDALAHLPSRFRLAIAGDGPIRDALAHHARRAGVDERVDFLGWLDADARDQLLVDADVVIVPSAPLPDGRVEGTPLAALEALAAGVPLVVTATGGLVDLALLGALPVAPRDPRALAAAIMLATITPAPPIPELDWATAGAVLDAHWGRTA